MFWLVLLPLTGLVNGSKHYNAVSANEQVDELRPPKD